MRNNKLRMAIRATAAVTVLGLASQAQAFSFSAGDVDADVYGYARLNASYDFNEEVATSGAYGSFSNVSDSDNEGHFNMSAYQSRVGVNAKHASGVSATVEGDFLGGGSNLRLRHAYGEYKGILAGQTWSNFNSFTGNTPVLDFSGVAGWAGTQARNSQIRYTTGGFSVALEDPKATIDGATEETDSGTVVPVQGGGTTTIGEVEESTVKNGLPALTARYEGSAGALSYSGAGVINQVEYEETTSNDSDSAVGYGVFGAAKFKISDMVSVQGNLQYTDGANSYLYLSGGDDAYVGQDRDLRTVSGIGGTIGTSITLDSQNSINVAYGMTKVDVDDNHYDAGQNETNSNAFVNYMFKPVQNVMMGVEYGYWKTETKGGSVDKANRVMFAAQYNF